MTLVLRTDTNGLAVGWPGAPGNPDYFATTAAAYATTEGPRVPVEQHAAFGADVAACLDVIVAPQRFIVAQPEGPARIILPSVEVAPLATFFAAPTQVNQIGTESARTTLQALDPNATGINADEKERRIYALATAGLLSELYADVVVTPERTTGLIQALAVAGVIVVVVAVQEWFYHLDHVAEVEADASVRREREVRAAASHDYVERLRLAAASPTHAMPEPTANEIAARSAIAQRAASVWDDLARNLTQTTSSITSAAMWLGLAWLGLQALKD